MLVGCLYLLLGAACVRIVTMRTNDTGDYGQPITLAAMAATQLLLHWLVGSQVVASPPRPTSADQAKWLTVLLLVCCQS